MQALAARGLDEAFQPKSFETLADSDRTFDDAWPSHALAGIEIEDEAIRPFQIGQGRAPDMHLKDA